MKTFLLSLLTILLPFVANADAVEIDGIYYNLISKAKEAEVTSNPNKYTGNIVIPDSITYDGVVYGVTSIGSSAFSNCSSLTSVYIPNSVTSIGDKAFSSCSLLSSVTIPNSVTSLGTSAFSGCLGLTSVDLGNSIKSIRKSTFETCTSLTSVTIPNSVTSIGEDSFQRCYSLTSLDIPNSVKSVGTSAFGYCKELTSISIPNSVTSIGTYAFQHCTAITSITLPNNLTSISVGTFDNCRKLISVTLPNTVTSIGISAFESCRSLISINIPNSVTTIDKYAFRDCNELSYVIIGSSVRSISSQAFAKCQELIDVYCLAESVPSTYSDAFYDSYIEYATLHVPAESVNAYQANVPWKNFKSIVVLDGDTPEPPETPKCATPTISYQNGHLIFESETEGVEFVTDITDNDIKRHYDSKISLTATYNITVYASKSGYDNSDVATATLCWIDQQPETDGIADGLAQIPARPVLIKTDSGVITVEGVDDQTNITLFTSDGKLAGSAISLNGSATIDTHLPSGTTAIVKIGEKSVKVVVR